jgi:hypothetical protein
MKLWIGTSSNPTQLAVHDLAEIQLVSEEAQMEPPEMPQREVRTITVRLEFFEQTFRENHELVEQVRAALKAVHPHIRLKEADHVYPAGSGQATVPGEVILDRPCEVLNHSKPEDPNAVGTYNQALVISLRYELTDLQGPATPHLTLQFTKTGGQALAMGNVLTFRTSYRASYISEYRNIRDRATGQVSASGEWLADTSDPLADRRAFLEALATDWTAQVNGADGTLVYGAFFNRVVKVENFMAEVNQAATGIKWTLDCNYTQFPDEATYASADYTVDVGEDANTGDLTLAFNGRLWAASEALALAKLATIRTAMLAAQGFASGQREVAEKTSRAVDLEDGASFLELNFRESYRRRMGNILGYTLQVGDADDTRTGLIVRTYSGTVTASGTTATDAYNNAAAKARLLGDNKHPVRLNARIGRGERQITATAAVEHVRVEFSYDYQLKGNRVFIELASETAIETFGEDSERVQGFVVAANTTAASTAYQDLVRAAFANRLIRSESTSEQKLLIQRGSYNGANWVASTGVTTMATRLDFSFTVFKPKASGSAIQYAISSDFDYTKLQEALTIKGTFVGTAALMTAAQARQAGNALDALLNPLTVGKTKVTSSRQLSRQKFGSLDEALTLEFTESWTAKLSSAAQVLQCEVAEEITYTGTRWVVSPIPDNQSVVQDCGIQEGSRSISGTILAATETAAMAWIGQIRQMAFPSGTGGGAAPSVRFHQPPRIVRSFKFLPLLTGVPRGGSANFQVVEVQFQFSELLPNFPYA